MSDLLPENGYGQNIKFLISTNPQVYLDPIAIEKTGYWCQYFEPELCTEEELYQIIMTDPTASQYMQAEMRFSLMMNDVYKILGEVMGLPNAQ